MNSNNTLSLLFSSLTQTQALFSNASEHITSIEARTVIEQVFHKEGIPLGDRIPYKKEETSFILDGYNSKHNIGYIWMDKFNLEKDTYIAWYKTQGKTQKKDYLKGLKFLATSEYSNSEVRQGAQEILDFPEKHKQEELYMHFIQKQRLKDIIVADKHPTLTKEAVAALQIADADSSQQKQAFNKVFQIAEIVDFAFDYSTSEHLQMAGEALLKLLDVEQQQAAFDSLQQLDRDEKMSLKEAIHIEKNMDDSKEFIALISQFDQRFSYNGKYHISSEKTRAKFAKIKNPEEQKQLALEITAKKREQLLQSLAQEVRLYIRWAKKQQKL